MLIKKKRGNFRRPYRIQKKRGIDMGFKRLWILTWLVSKANAFYCPHFLPGQNLEFKSNIIRMEEIELYQAVSKSTSKELFVNKSYCYKCYINFEGL